MAILTEAAVDAYSIPKKMNKWQLEWWILFGICVANKPAAITEKKLKAFLDDGVTSLSPFENVKMFDSAGCLDRHIKMHRFGQYGRILGAFRGVVGLDLAQISVESLEAVKGIGPKTARMIMLYYDPKCDAVPLDTHVLKYLRAKGVKDVPKSTPSAGKNYIRLENEFKDLAIKQGKTVRELDTEVWLSYARPKKV